MNLLDPLIPPPPLECSRQSAASNARSTHGTALQVLWLLLGMLLLPACSPAMTMRISYRPPLPTVDRETLLVGAARVDLTPEPGKPMAGYSAHASTSSGVRTRINARIFYLKPAHGQPVALVQCDLLSGSRILHRKVAELIAARTDVPLEGLLIAGTHTHSGPGGFFGSDFYNRFASNVPGLDPDYFNQVAEQMAAGIVQAYEARRPGRIAFGTTEVWGYTRNRSPEAHLANSHITDREMRPERVYQLVNPVLSMLRIDAQTSQGDFRPLGAFSNFSIHGTAVPHDFDVYNGDVFTYVEQELEWNIRETYRPEWPPVHAVSNATHGDNSPDYRFGLQGFIEARRLGLGIAEQAWKLFQSLEPAANPDLPISVTAREVDLYQEPEYGGVTLCSTPVAGSALIAGADDGSTPVLRSLPFFAQGWPRKLFTRNCQGSKRWFGSKTGQRIYLPRDGFPHHLFLQVIRIGDAVYVPLPFEVTSEMGKRIAAAAKRGAAASIPANASVVVISCSNDYFGYVTTPEEYALQYYEGGHTLYGPRTGPFLAAHLETLAGELAAGKQSWKPPEQIEVTLKVRPSAVKHAGPQPARAVERTVSHTPVFQLAAQNLEASWSFQWMDAAPEALRFHEPLAYMEVREDDGPWQKLVQHGRPVDDDGYDLQIKLVQLKGDTSGIYEARWFNPEHLPGRQYRFVVLPRAGQPIFYSPDFH